MSSADQHTETVGRLYKAFGDGDVQTILDLMSDEVEFGAEATGSVVPWYGNRHGKAGVASFFEAIGQSVEVTKFDVKAMTDNDTDVIAVVDWSFKVRQTGKSASMLMFHWWQFDDSGKVIAFRGSEDSAQAVAAFS